MTHLEFWLLFILYIINGAFMYHKQRTSSIDMTIEDIKIFSVVAFFFNPLWLIGVAIIKVLFRKW